MSNSERRIWLRMGLRHIPAVLALIIAVALAALGQQYAALFFCQVTAMLNVIVVAWNLSEGGLMQHEGDEGDETD